LARPDPTAIRQQLADRFKIPSINEPAAASFAATISSAVPPARSMQLRGPATIFD
jgi:hypothetical protein